MRVTLIHQYFVGSRDAGGTRHAELAHGLVDRGHDVTAIAGTVSYLTGGSLGEEPGPEQGPHPRLRVVRTWTYAAVHRSFLGRALGFLSFSFSSLLAALRTPADVVWGTSPPIPQALTAAVVARLKGVPFVFEVRDLWPDFPIQLGVLKHPAIMWAARRLERFLYRSSDRIVVNSPGFVPHLTRSGVALPKITAVPNGADVDAFDPQQRDDAFRCEHGLEGKFLAVYAGAHGLANDLGTVLRAAERLAATEEIVFVLVGDGKEKPGLMRAAAALGLRNVVFLPALPKAQMPEVLAAADVGIAVLRGIPMFTTTYPNKVFDYMAAGRPTILGIDGVIREVIEASGGGLFVTPGDDRAMAAAVLRLHGDPGLCRRMGAGAREYVVDHFSRRQQVEALDALLRGLQSAASRRAPAYPGKRLLDLAVAVPALACLSPLLLAVALAVRLKLGAPVLFEQQRPGLNGDPFTLRKFRTMTDDRDREGQLLADDVRLTAFGRLLRATSLDELPELFNVVRGEMSVVGPRPLLADYLQQYTPEQMRRHDVRPGITGWAQVNGRNATTWDQRFACDVWYVDHQSLWLDLKIIVMTLGQVLRREGISQPGHATMPPFTGTAVGGGGA